MPWTVYTIHVTPKPLRDPDRFEPGTVLRVVDPTTRQQIPPEGADVRVTSREIERYWDRNERAGDVEIVMADEPAPMSGTSRKSKTKRTSKPVPEVTADTPTDDEVTS